MSRQNELFASLAICSVLAWPCIASIIIQNHFNHEIFFVFTLYLVVTATVGQKPLDRGVHKRTTGGVSFLFGEKSQQD